MANEVDAGNVESDDACGERGDFGGFRMHRIGDVEFVIGVALDEYLAPGVRNGIGRQVLARKVDVHRRIHVNFCKRMVFAHAAARVAVDLRFNQFVDR